MKRIICLTMTLFVMLFINTPLVTAQPMGYGMTSGWGMGWFGGIFMFIFWIFIIIGIFFLVRWLIQTTREESGKNIDNSQNALDILKERYARGEINKQEFEEKKKDLL